MLQTMCALSGMRSQINIIPGHKYIIKGKEGFGKEAYNLTINPEIAAARVDERHFSVENYSGIVWCVNNENTTLVTRRHGLISIQGNCLGKAIDFNVQGMSSEEARRLIKLHAPSFPCNVRLERGVSWVHFDVVQQWGVTDRVYEFNA